MSMREDHNYGHPMVMDGLHGRRDLIHLTGYVVQAANCRRLLHKGVAKSPK